MTTTNRHLLYQEFRKTFPLETLKDMPLEKYTNLNKDSFCYWLESETKALGSFSGGSSYKFGIYQYQEQNKPKATDPRVQSDGKYVWYKKYQKDTAEEAYQIVLKMIVDIATFANEGNYEAIDAIDLGEAYKWNNAYQKLTGIKDTRVPSAYWQFLHEVKEGDTVVVIGARKNEKGSSYHELYGWGRISSDYTLHPEAENPVWRTIEWHLPSLTEPIENHSLKDSLFFQKVDSPGQVNHIKQLLNIQQNAIPMNNECQQYIDLLESTHNLILTGAPGTGKTYLAKKIAKEMGAKVGFVQFHPSYDYTDFVEGLRPTPPNNNGNIGFERKDGVFKLFCKRALLNKEYDNIAKEINDNPTVWKVSLEGTGDNPTRTDCMLHDCIRVGWSSYGDIDNFEDFEDFKDGGKLQLRAFQNKMQIGDIVISCYSATETDAIGIITGDYEYKAEGGQYPRYRTVKWLVKGIRENIVALNNNKPFTLSTVYRSAITADDALKIVHKYDTDKHEETRKKPFVFIIDEINRGEISKIFGELFFSVDPGYRGESGRVSTQYQNMIEEGDVFSKGFFIPDNVYIIGTMNDIDRSVESMDFAMRRRFAWQEITAEESMQMLDNLAFGEEAKARMQRLNEAIIKIPGLNKAYQIGAAYFLKLKGDNFDALWRNHIEGILQEYLRGNRNAEEQLKTLKEAYDNKATVETEHEDDRQ